MAQFLLVYRGGGVESREGTAEDQDRISNSWESWKNGLGSKLVDPGSSTADFLTVGRNGREEFISDRIAGFSVIEADSFDAAIEIAKSCPTVTGTNDGKCDVYSLTDFRGAFPSGLPPELPPDASATPATPAAPGTVVGSSNEVSAEINNDDDQKPNDDGSINLPNPNG